MTSTLVLFVSQKVSVLLLESNCSICTSLQMWSFVVDLVTHKAPNISAFHRGWDTLICNAPGLKYKYRIRGAEQLASWHLAQGCCEGPVGCAETEPGWPGYRPDVLTTGPIRLDLGQTGSGCDSPRVSCSVTSASPSHGLHWARQASTVPSHSLSSTPGRRSGQCG
jgi:hypothetical protein